MAGSNGKQKTVRDMILSLGLIGIAAAVVYIFIPHSDHAPDVKRVDYRVELLTARRAAPYPVAAPEGVTGAAVPAASGGTGFGGASAMTPSSPARGCADRPLGREGSPAHPSEPAYPCCLPALGGLAR